MSAVTLHELNQRYIRLADRCRSQWTFYQLLQGLFKHLRNLPCPVELDFPNLFSELRKLSDELSDSTVSSGARVLAELSRKVDTYASQLRAVDVDVPPSLLRRFFDRLRHQDEKVILAIIKFYLDGGTSSPDTLDKLDILFTRLAELPAADGRSVARQPHEIERLIRPILDLHPRPTAPKEEVDILARAVTEIKAEVLQTTNFSQLVEGGALDRFRSLKRRLGEALLNPTLLPVVVDTTIAIKNRFRELLEEEESRLLEDTNRVRELERQLNGHPELVTPELRDLLESFMAASHRYTAARNDENVRRADVLELRKALNQILEAFDTSHSFPPPLKPPPTGDEEVEETAATDEAEPAAAAPLSSQLPADPLLHDYISKIVFALELAGTDRSAEEAVQAKELATLRLEPAEVEACRALTGGRTDLGSLSGQRQLLLLQAAALRVRMDEEAKEIDRLQRRGSDKLAEVLERATASLQRAAEMDRRFLWFIDDALYRGETDHLEMLYRSRFRLLRAYSGLWLIHNARGGISPF